MPSRCNRRRRQGRRSAFTLCREYTPKQCISYAIIGSDYFLLLNNESILNTSAPANVYAHTIQTYKHNNCHFHSIQYHTQRQRVCVCVCVEQVHSLYFFTGFAVAVDVARCVPLAPHT